jgi:hypothetical protein
LFVSHDRKKALDAAASDDSVVVRGDTLELVMNGDEPLEDDGKLIFVTTGS